MYLNEQIGHLLFGFVTRNRIVAGRRRRRCRNGRVDNKRLELKPSARVEHETEDDDQDHRDGDAVQTAGPETRYQLIHQV